MFGVEDRRRMTRRQRRAPNEVLLWAEALRQVLGRRYAGAVWAAELRPIGPGQRDLRNQQPGKPAHRSLVYTGGLQAAIRMRRSSRLRDAGRPDVACLRDSGQFLIGGDLLVERLFEQRGRAF